MGKAKEVSYKEVLLMAVCDYLLADTLKCTSLRAAAVNFGNCCEQAASNSCGRLNHCAQCAEQ